MDVSVKTLEGKAAGKAALDDAIFGVEDIRSDILHRAVRWHCLLYTSPSPRD